MKNNTLYKLTHRAIDAWGLDFQTEMIVEECAELIHAIKKFKRGKISPEALLEEIVDVEIMIAQAKLMYSTKKEHGHMMKKKLMRLKGMLDESELNKPKLKVVERIYSAKYSDLSIPIMGLS